MYLSPEEKAVGQGNFQNAIGVTRRDFLKTGIAAGAVSGAGLGAMYFGYEAAVSNPLRVGFIGTGDEGNVLIGALCDRGAKNLTLVVNSATHRYSATHELIDGDGAIKHSFNVRGDRLVVVETIVKSFGLFIERLHKGVNVVFTIAAVKPTAIQRSVQTVPEIVRLVFDAMQNPLYLFIAQSIWLPNDLCLRQCRCA